MALRGNLRDFTITQLLNLINLAQKTGTLVVDGPSEQAYISFRDGKLAYARVGQEDGTLATVAVNAPGSRAANPSFDVTPARLVTAFITERGVCPASREGLLSLYPERAARACEAMPG